jgi:hypothetical protein
VSQSAPLSESVEAGLRDRPAHRLAVEGVEAAKRPGVGIAPEFRALPHRNPRRALLQSHDQSDASRDLAIVEARERSAFDLDASADRRQQPGDGPEQGRLAGGVRPDQRHAFARADLQRHVAHGLARAATDGEA